PVPNRIRKRGRVPALIRGPGPKRGAANASSALAAGVRATGGRPGGDGRYAGVATVHLGPAGAPQRPHPRYGPGLHAQPRRRPPHLLPGPLRAPRPLRLPAAVFRPSPLVSRDGHAAWHPARRTVLPQRRGRPV